MFGILWYRCLGLFYIVFVDYLFMCFVSGCLDLSCV